MNKVQDKVIGKDNYAVSRIQKVLDGFKESAKWAITKYANDADKLAGKIYSEAEAMAHFGTPQVVPVHGNELTNAGINLVMSAICVTGQTLFSAANAYLCVGDSTTAFAASQTDLQAATNKVRVAMTGGFPTYGTSQKATWKASFGSAVANWAWQEFAVANASTGGTILNRKVSVQGTKASGQTWDLTLEITLA